MPKSPTQNVLKQCVSNETSPTRNLLYHPREAMYFSPAAGMRYELDINRTFYFQTYDEIIGEEEWNPVDRDTIVRAIFSKTSDREGFPGRFMVTENNRVLPFHLPTPEDSGGRIPAGLLAYIEWEARSRAEFEAFEVIPYNYLPFIDPIPVLHIDQTPVYTVPIKKTPIFFGSYTDGLHVMKNSNYIHSIDVDVFYREGNLYKKGYHHIHLGSTEQYVGHTTPTLLAKGLLVVIWNARGVTRPSFKEHFYRIFSQLTPSIIIVTESRINEPQLLLIAQTLPGTYQHDLFGPEGRAGGVVMFWSVNQVQPSITYRHDPVCQMGGAKPKHLASLQFHVSVFRFT